MAKITYTDKVIGSKWKAIDANEVKESVNDLYDEVSSIDTELDTKVDKVTGKGLSEEDYTTVEKSKLAGLNAADYLPKSDVSFVSVKELGVVGDGVTNDTAAILAALSAYNNLYFPAGNYLASFTISGNNKTLRFDKSFWTGSAIGGSYITGVVSVTGDDNFIDGIGVHNTSGTGGVIISGNASRNTIINGLFNTFNHGVLIEQFGGTATDNKVINCEAHGCISGFVSKSDNTSFINCRAYNTSVNGFAIISDNLTGASLKSLNRNNKIINCDVYNSNIGINIYSRDVFSTNNANGLELRNLSIIGGNVKDSATYGILVGDELAPPGGQTYNDVLNITINGVNIDTAGTAGIRYSRCNVVSVVGTNSNKFYDKDANAKQLHHFNNNISTGSLGDVVFNTVLTANSTTPSILNGDVYFETNNTLSTTISNFTGAKVGQVIWVLIKDTFTTISSGGNIALTGGTIKGAGSIVCLKQRDNASGWDEIISRSELRGSATYDPPSIASGSQATTTVTVTKASVGDHAQVSFSNNLTGLTLTGYVSATDTVTAVFFNGTGAPVDLASGTLRAKVTSA